jgi:hypothetical protein
MRASAMEDGSRGQIVVQVILNSADALIVTTCHMLECKCMLISLCFVGMKVHKSTMEGS